MCRLAGRRCPSSQGPAGPGVYATRRTNRKYRRDLADLVRSSGNDELASQIMKAPFASMPMLTSAAGLCADEVSSAPMPGQTQNHAVDYSDVRLSREIGKVSGEIIAHADSVETTPKDADAAFEKVVDEVTDIGHMTPEQLEEEQESLQRRIEMLGVQADKADERGKFRLAESIDRDIENAEHRLSLVRSESSRREMWDEHAEAVHEANLAYAADPYYRTDDEMDTFARDYRRDPMYVTGLSDDALRTIYDTVPGDDPESRDARVAAMYELVERNGELPPELKESLLRDKISHSGFSAANGFPGSDHEDCSEVLTLMGPDGSLDTMRENLADVDPSDHETVVASLDRMSRLSTAQADIAHAIDEQVKMMGPNDTMSGPYGSEMTREQAQQLVYDLRKNSLDYGDEMQRLQERAGLPDDQLPAHMTMEADDLASAGARKALQYERMGLRDDLDYQRRQNRGPEVDEIAAMSDGKLHVETATAVIETGVTGKELRRRIANEHLLRTGSMPSSLAEKLVQDQVDEKGFSVFNQDPGKQDLGSVALAAGNEGSQKSLDRLLHSKGQTDGVDESTLRDNWRTLDAQSDLHREAAESLRTQAALMGPDHVMAGISDNDSMTRDQVLARADLLQSRAEEIGTAAEKVGQEYRRRGGDLSDKEISSIRADRKVEVAAQKQAVEMGRRWTDEEKAAELRGKLRERIAESGTDNPSSGPSPDSDYGLDWVDRTMGDVTPGGNAHRMLQSESLRTTAGDPDAEKVRSEFDRISGLASPTKSPKFAEVTGKEMEYVRADLAAARELRETASGLDDGGRIVVANDDYTPDSDGDPEASLTKEHALSVADAAEKAATERLGKVERLMDARDFPSNIGVYTDKAADALGEGVRPSVSGIAEAARKIDPIKFDTEISKAKNLEEYTAALQAAHERHRQYNAMGAVLRDVNTASGGKPVEGRKDDRRAIREAAERLSEASGNGYWIDGKEKEAKSGFNDARTLSNLQETAPKVFKDVVSRKEKEARERLERDAGRSRYGFSDNYGDRVDPHDRGALNDMFIDTYSEHSESRLARKVDKALEKMPANGNAFEVAHKVMASATPKDVDDYADHLWIDFHDRQMALEKEFSDDEHWQEHPEVKKNASAYLLSSRERFEELRRICRKDPERLVDLRQLTYDQSDIYDIPEPNREAPPEGMKPLFDLPEPKKSA